MRRCRRAHRANVPIRCQGRPRALGQVSYPRGSTVHVAMTDGLRAKASSARILPAMVVGSATASGTSRSHRSPFPAGASPPGMPKRAARSGLHPKQRSRNESSSLHGLGTRCAVIHGEERWPIGRAEMLDDITGVTKTSSARRRTVPRSCRVVAYLREGAHMSRGDRVAQPMAHRELRRRALLALGCLAISTVGVFGDGRPSLADPNHCTKRAKRCKKRCRKEHGRHNGGECGMKCFAICL